MRVSLIVWSVLVLVIFKTTASNRCDRTPDRPLRPKNADAGDKYVIEIDGDPTSYLAGETYTVTLKHNPILGEKHMFKEFMLSVEQEDIESQNDIDSIHKVGYLKLSDDRLSLFSRRCENTILQTSTVLKSSITVYWIAPPTGSGCVAFRATVVESKENWYSEDGSLTKILCEEISENEDVQPAVLDECSACDEAKYELVFEGLWTRNTHPQDYPSNIWYTKFGDIVGSSHANGESFWKYGDVADENLRALAEKGDTSGIETELKEKMGKTVRTIVKANGLRYPNITGRTFTFFRVDGKNHLVSIVSKIIPSPDWIVGVSDFELCHKDGTWAEQRIMNLYPWDIGTDDGVSYNSPSEPADVPGKIERMDTNDEESPFYTPEGKEMKPFAKIYLTRLKTYEKGCDEQTTTISPEEGTTEEQQSETCATTPWSDWSPCSEKCGDGFMFRKRDLINPDDEEMCSVKLVEQNPCTGRKCKSNHHNMNFIPVDDPRCELTEWSEWSSCSVACGKGTMTREKRFKTPEYSAQCENNDPMNLQQNEECKGEETDCPDDGVEGPDCSKTVWGPWTPCNVTCGTGFKRRLRMPDSGDEEDGITESGCSNMEEVKCYLPFCKEEDTTGSSFGEITSLNQITTENIFSQPFGPVANCKVSSWSVWGPCELNDGKCGKGYTTQYRQILQHAMNGGKSCPIKLMRKKRCHISCNPKKEPESSTTPTDETENSASPVNEITETTTEESLDCIMSHWSQWSPCSLSCGGSAVQQRTRSIRRPARKNGKPCGPRLDQRACPLPLACTDKGVPIM